MGGWWKADNSSFCGGPRYYMDCNATCQCTTGCGRGFPFCDTQCDGTNCGCGPDGCSSFMVGCLQFRYGQCNQDVACMGRIVCRVVACVPPWEVDPTCTTALAVDNGTAEQNVACWTTAPPSPPCGSPATNCQVATMAGSADGAGYAILTSFGKLFTYGDFADDGDQSATVLNKPVVGMAATPTGKGYWLVAADGGIFTFGDAQFFGSTGGHGPQQAGGGHGRHPGREGLLAGGGRRRHLHLRRRPVLRLHGRPRSSTSRWWAWPPPRPGRATGSWRPTAASSPSATPSSSAPRAATVLNKPVVGMAATPTGKGYWFVAADGGIFTFGDAQFFGSIGGHGPQQAGGGHGRHPDREGLLVRGGRRRHLHLRRRPVLRLGRVREGVI